MVLSLGSKWKILLLAFKCEAHLNTKEIFFSIEKYKVDKDEEEKRKKKEK